MSTTIDIFPSSYELVDQVDQDEASIVEIGSESYLPQLDHNDTDNESSSDQIEDEINEDLNHETPEKGDGFGFKMNQFISLFTFCKSSNNQMKSKSHFWLYRYY